MSITSRSEEEDQSCCACYRVCVCCFFHRLKLKGSWCSYCDQDDCARLSSSIFSSLRIGECPSLLANLFIKHEFRFSSLKLMSVVDEISKRVVVKVS